MGSILGHDAVVDNEILSLLSRELKLAGKHLQIVKSLNSLRIAELSASVQVEKYRADNAERTRDALAKKVKDSELHFQTMHHLYMSLQEEKALATSGINYSHESEQPQTSHLDLATQLRYAENARDEVLSELDQLKVSMQHLEESLKDDIVLSETSHSSADLTKVGSSPCANTERDRNDGTTEIDFEIRLSFIRTWAMPKGLPAELKPLNIPFSWSLTAFFASLPEHYKPLLVNHKVFSEETTYWCFDEEIHGIHYLPRYRPVYVPCRSGRRGEKWLETNLEEDQPPFETFFWKEKKLFYAGTYQSFRMKDLTIQECLSLPEKFFKAMLKQTLAIRPQAKSADIFEIQQLYLAGVLRVACLALQCVGYNQDFAQALTGQMEIQSVIKPRYRRENCV